MQILIVNNSKKNSNSIGNQVDESNKLWIGNTNKEVRLGSGSSSTSNNRNQNSNRN